MPISSRMQTILSPAQKRCRVEETSEQNAKNDSITNENPTKTNPIASSPSLPTKTNPIAVLNAVPNAVPNPVAGLNQVIPSTPNAVPNACPNDSVAATNNILTAHTNAHINMPAVNGNAEKPTGATMQTYGQPTTLQRSASQPSLRESTSAPKSKSKRGQAGRFSSKESEAVKAILDDGEFSKKLDKWNYLHEEFQKRFPASGRTKDALKQHTEVLKRGSLEKHGNRKGKDVSEELRQKLSAAGAAGGRIAKKGRNAPYTLSSESTSSINTNTLAVTRLKHPKYEKIAETNRVAWATREKLIELRKKWRLDRMENQGEYKITANVDHREMLKLLCCAAQLDKEKTNNTGSATYFGDLFKKLQDNHYFPKRKTFDLSHPHWIYMLFFPHKACSLEKQDKLFGGTCKLKEQVCCKVGRSKHPAVNDSGLVIQGLLPSAAIVAENQDDVEEKSREILQADLELEAEMKNMRSKNCVYCNRRQYGKAVRLESYREESGDKGLNFEFLSSVPNEVYGWVVERLLLQAFYAQFGFPEQHREYFVKTGNDVRWKNTCRTIFDSIMEEVGEYFSNKVKDEGSETFFDKVETFISENSTYGFCNNNNNIASPKESRQDSSKGCRNPDEHEQALVVSARVMSLSKLCDDIKSRVRSNKESDSDLQLTTAQSECFEKLLQCQKNSEPFPTNSINGRKLVLSPTGSGKSLLIHLAILFSSGAQGEGFNRRLLVVPSLALQSQYLIENFLKPTPYNSKRLEEAGKAFDVLLVGSLKKNDLYEYPDVSTPESERASDLMNRVTVTTNPTEIRERLDSSEPLLVISTYCSLELVVQVSMEMQDRQASQEFYSIVVLDEAHRAISEIKKDVLFATGFENCYKQLMGFTATAGKNEDIDMRKDFQLIYERHLHESMQDNIVRPLDICFLPDIPSGAGTKWNSILSDAERDLAKELGEEVTKYIESIARLCFSSQDYESVNLLTFHPFAETDCHSPIEVAAKFVKKNSQTYNTLVRSIFDTVSKESQFPQPNKRFRKEDDTGLDVEFYCLTQQDSKRQQREILQKFTDPKPNWSTNRRKITSGGKVRLIASCCVLDEGVDTKFATHAM